MKISLIASLGAAAMLAASGSQAARVAAGFTDHARVIDVEPIVRTVRIEHPDFVTQALTLAVEGGHSQALSVDLARGGRLSGSVLRADGTPPDLAAVELRPLDRSDPPTVEHVLDGTIRQGGLRPGRYQVRAQAFGGGNVSPWCEPVTVVVAVGETAEVDLRVPAPRSP